MGQLSPLTTTTNPVFQSLCSATREATTMRSPHATTREEPPLTTTRESPHAATKTQCSQKNKQKKKKTKETNLQKQYCQFEKHVAIPLYGL